MTITGTGFTNVRGVLFGNTFYSVSDTRDMGVLDANHIVVKSPPATQLGAVDINVLNGFGSTVSNSGDQFSYTGTVPASQTGSILSNCTGGAVDVLRCVGGAYGIYKSIREAAGLVSALRVAIPFISTILEGDSLFLVSTLGAERDHVACGSANLFGSLLSVVTIGILVFLTAFTIWDLFIDPSGNVIDQNGNPVSGASASLLGQGVPGGTFSPVPPGSGAIEPATNPETTDAGGIFDWDALAGTYEVQASAAGCQTRPATPHNQALQRRLSSSRHPALGLQVVLNCPSSSWPVPTVTQLAPASGSTPGRKTRSKSLERVWTTRRLCISVRSRQVRSAHYRQTSSLPRSLPVVRLSMSRWTDTWWNQCGYIGWGSV